MKPLTPAPAPDLIANVAEILDAVEIASPEEGIPVVVIFDAERNYFAQFAPGESESEVLAEIVGPDFLGPQHQFSGEALDLLLSYGWNLADSDEFPNHHKVWDSELIDLDLIVTEVLSLACAIFKIDGATATIEVIQ